MARSLTSLIGHAPRRHVLRERLLKRHKSESEAVSQVLATPYATCLALDGIGWMTADAVAGNIGIDKDHPDRLAAGIVEAMTRQEAWGHCWHLPGDLHKSLRALTGVNSQASMAAIQIAVDRDAVHTDDGERLYLPKLHAAEIRVTEALVRLSHCRDLRGVLEVPPDGATDLHRDQWEAVHAIANVAVSVITGAPGTGKTYMLKEVLDRFTGSVELCAPTGRAAKRLSELTERPASTIHRLLGPKFVAGKFTFTRESVDPDLLVIDESSMLSLTLAAALLSRVSSGTRVVFIGDPHQLPAVGPGDVLRDIIKAGPITVARLTKIKRQDPGEIILGCHAVLHGVTPKLLPPGQADLAFLECKSDGEAAAAARGLLQNAAMREKYGGTDDYTGIQVITPRRKKGSPISCTDFNAAIAGDRNHYLPADKVMVTKNNYSLGVFNGDCGRVVSDMAGRITVSIDGEEVTATRSKWSLDFAWATTVHKFQGSQVPIAICLVHEAAGPMLLSRTLFYTALSRAERLCILVGTRSAIESAVKNDRDERRRTGLADRLRSAVIEHREGVRV